MHNMEVGGKFIPPGSGNSVYMPIPDSRRDANRELLYPASFMADVDMLYKSMKGCGTNEDVLVRVLCNRTADQIEAIEQLYFKKYGLELEESIKEDLSGDCEDAAVMLVRGQVRPSAWAPDWLDD